MLILINTSIRDMAMELIWNELFLFCTGRFGISNCTSFGANMSSSAHDDNKKTDILILGKDPTQWLDYKALTAEIKSIQSIF